MVDFLNVHIEINSFLKDNWPIINLESSVLRYSLINS